MPTLDDASLALAQRVGGHAHWSTVVAATPLSTSLIEIVLLGDAVALAGVPGNDVMIRVSGPEGRAVRRRYSVRDVDAANDTLTLWVSVAHDGPGSRWARSAAPGDEVEVIGPRGQIPLDEKADWHLFVGDVSGLGAFYRMAKSIETPGRAIFIVEIDAPDDALGTTFDEGLGVTGIFVDRAEREPADPTGLLRGLAALATPPDLGHAYLFGEFHVMRAIKTALLDRGLSDDQINVKAYWRAGRSNAEHGEPEKD